MAVDSSSDNAVKRSSWLPKAVLILCVLQPILDIVSYWIVYFNMGSWLSLGLRFLVFAAVVVSAMVMSDRKKAYWICLVVCAFIFAGHVLACRSAWGAEYGIAWLFSDATNFIRIIQLPLFAMAFITFFRRADGCWDAVEKGFFIALCIIFACEAVSTLTGTDPHTYPNKSLGILGWFYFANSQSAILCAAVPVALCMVMKKEKPAVTAIFCAAVFAVLFMFGTRLSYLGALIIGFGTVLTWLLVKKLKWPAAVTILVCMAACLALVQVSPWYVNQSKHQEILAQKQADIDSLVQQGKNEYGADDVEYLRPAYEKYLGGLVDKYGLERVAERYGETTDAEKIVNVRRLRIEYCSMLMEDAPVSVKLFGLPLDSLTYENYVYDVENDYHGIFFLYGGAGLAALAVFLLYFVVIITGALIKNPKKYFTVEAGAVGIALITLFLHSYFTAGVLRRPNASFYFSVCLAAAYYLVKIREEGCPVEHVRG